MAKQKFKITNWPAYNNALRQRGSLTVWLDEAAIAAWTETTPPERRGRPLHYTDMAIITVLMMKRVFSLSLRALQGFVDSIFKLMALSLQEEMMAALRFAHPAKLRAKIRALSREHVSGDLIDHVFIPVRQRISLDQNTAHIMCSLLDGVLIEFVSSCLAEARKKAGKDALLIGWDTEDRTRLWLEAWRLSQQGWHIAVLAEPQESPRPELFPGQQLIVWTGITPTRRQQELLQHWREQGYSLIFHHV